MTSTYLPQQFRYRAAELFDQQLWCFGRDILGSGGNILLDLGMCQYRPAASGCGSTLYTTPIEPGGQLFLWGFGAMYREAGLGAVFLRRYGFAPRLSDRETAVGVFAPEELGPLINPVSNRDEQRLQTLLPRLVGWFAKYEHWIAERFGHAYRDECLSLRGKQNSTQTRAMARDWERIAKQCKHYHDTGDLITNPWQHVLHLVRHKAVFRGSSIVRPSTRVAS